MGAAELIEITEEETPAPCLGLTPDPVEVRRRIGPGAAIAAAAAAVAVAYGTRAWSTSAVLDWVLCGVLAVIAVAYLWSLRDARAPLLVADRTGLRVRLGRSWAGLPWTALRHVDHLPRRGWWRDGRILVEPHHIDRVLAELDASGRRQARWNTRWYGAPLGVPLGPTTRVLGGTGELTEALSRLAGDQASVVEVSVEPTEALDEPVADSAPPEDSEPPTESEPEQPTRRRLRPLLGELIGRISARLHAPRDNADPDPESVESAESTESTESAELPQPEPEPVLATATPAPVRPAATATRVDDSLDRPQPVDLQPLSQEWTDRVRPIARVGEPVPEVSFDDAEPTAAPDPVIGPELAAARTRLGLSLDQLAERTRIRPHIIEAIEVDDFARCGGDFYARGHLRTLARVLGVEAAPLLSAYADRYADAPIDPRRVFEAELATTGSIRGTRGGGPNWSVLVAALMLVVLAWSVVRLVMDTPPDPSRSGPVLNGSDGVSNGRPGAPEIPLVITASAGGAKVVIRDGSGATVFNGALAFGETRTFSVSPPVRVQSSDGGIRVTVDGDDRGTMGSPGTPSSATYVVD